MSCKPFDGAQVDLRIACGLCIVTALAVLISLSALASSAIAAKGGQIAGKVTSAATKAPIAGVEVCPERLIGGWPSCALTDSGGEYTVEVPWAGNYRVQFKAPTASSYIRRT
jgi:hypothetical protein